MLFHQFRLKCLGKQKIASPGVMLLCSSFANTVESLSVLALNIPHGAHINNPAIGCIQALSLRIEGHLVGCVGFDFFGPYFMITVPHQICWLLDVLFE
jgi:hypothetical protein